MNSQNSQPPSLFSACRSWVQCLAVCGLLIFLTVPAYAQPLDPQKKAEALYDLFGSVYPGATGAQSLFNKAESDPILRAELERMIRENPDLAERAAEGNEYRRAYFDQLSGSLEGDARNILFAPINSALESLRRFQASHFQVNYQQPPDWKILRDAWEETLGRFGLNRAMTPADLEKGRRESELFERAHEYFVALKQRMEYRETPELSESKTTDVQKWKRYFLKQINFSREHNLRQALVQAAVYSKAKFRTDVAGRLETLEYYSDFWNLPAFVSNSLRAELRAEDFARARVYLISAQEESRYENYPDQGIFRARGRTLLNITRSFFRAFYTVNHLFNVWHRKLPTQTMKTEKPVSIEHSGTLFSIGNSYVLVAFDVATLKPAARRLMERHGGTLKFSTSDFSKTVLEGMFTDSVLHYESAHAREKRFVSEAALRDLQMADVQRLISDDESKAPAPLIEKLKNREASLRTVRHIYPPTLAEEARGDSDLKDAQTKDAVTGLKWWGQSIFPAYWTVRDAIATKHGRPVIGDVVAGKVKLKSNPLAHPVSRLTSHFRTGSKVKRAFITAGILGLLYSTPLWIEPAREMVKSSAQGIGESISKTLQSWLGSGHEKGAGSATKSEGEEEDGEEGEGGKDRGDSKSRQARLKKYEKPYIAKKRGGTGSGDVHLFYVLPGTTGIAARPYFYSYADSFETMQEGPNSYSIQGNRMHRVTSNDPRAHEFPLKKEKEAQADYYIESTYEYRATIEEYRLGIEKIIPVPLAHNHEIVSVTTHLSRYGGFWFDASNDVSAFTTNGYGFLKLGFISSPFRLRIGYRIKSDPAVPLIDKPLDKTALAQTADGLSRAGFLNLGHGVQTLLTQKSDVTFNDLERRFSSLTTYAYSQVGKESPKISNPYSHLTEFLSTNGSFHAQCTGSFEMFRTFADQYKIISRDSTFKIAPYTGFSVDPQDPMKITSGGGHIVARFTQTSDGASAVFDATGADPSVSSKASNPWHGPMHNPKAKHPSEHPWNRRRRELWMGHLADAKFALHRLKKIMSTEANFEQSRQSLENSLAQMREAIAEAKPAENEFRQSPSTALMDVLPDLVAHKKGDLTEVEVTERMLRKLSMFLSFDLKNTGLKSVLSDFYDNTRRYFERLNNWADNEPHRVVGLEALLDKKFQEKTLQMASALYYTNWKQPFYRMPRRSCEEMLAAADTEDWIFWDNEMRSEK